MINKIAMTLNMTPQKRSLLRHDDFLSPSTTIRASRFINSATITKEDDRFPDDVVETFSEDSSEEVKREEPPLCPPLPPKLPLESNLSP